MNRISNINFGEIILSKKLKRVMEENKQNPSELVYLKEAKPDCYINLRFTKTNKPYLQATETEDFLKNTLTEVLELKGGKFPTLSDILTLYTKFQKSVGKRDTM